MRTQAEHLETELARGMRLFVEQERSLDEIAQGALREGMRRYRVAE